MVLIIIAIVKLLNGGPVSKSKALLDAGSAISVIAWVLVALWTVWSYSMIRQFSSYSDEQTVGNGKIVGLTKILHLERRN